jgi:hypothetical protein
MKSCSAIADAVSKSVAFNIATTLQCYSSLAIDTAAKMIEVVTEN